MDGFKNTTKTQYFKGGSTHEAKGAAKVAKVMGEFKSGKLHSGSKNGPEVTSRKQATAIAMSEARKAGAKMPMKKAEGGSVEADDALMSRMTSRELAMGAAGIRAARARLAKEPASGPAKKLPPKAVPVASKRPMIESKKGYGPASSLSIPFKNGGPVKKAVGGPATAAKPAATTPAARAARQAEFAAKEAALNARMAGFKDRIKANEAVDKAKRAPMEAALNARMASFKDRIGVTRPTPMPVMPTPMPWTKGVGAPEPKGVGAPPPPTSIQYKNGGKVKKAVGGPVTLPPVVQSGAGKVMGPAEVRAKAAATSAHATATLQKLKDAQATRAASQQKHNDLMASNRQQAEKNAAARAALAPQIAENKRMQEANAASMARNNQMRAANATTSAANRQKMAEVNQRQTALGQPTIPVRRASGGLAAMPKGKC